jgi:hypothetical protein
MKEHRYKPCGAEGCCYTGEPSVPVSELEAVMDQFIGSCEDMDGKLSLFWVFTVLNSLVVKAKGGE